MLAVCAVMAGSVCAWGDVAIDAEHFPDEVFREYVSSDIDTNHNGRLSDEEIASVTAINVTGKNITSLQGIEYFTALTDLKCRENQLTVLDVSNNTALTELDCSYNQLTSLDVSKNTVLQDIVYVGNQLMALDVSNNTALYTLWCWNNQWVCQVNCV